MLRIAVVAVEGFRPFPEGFVNTGLRPWPAGHSPRRAGVNSLGIGGTNAHVILEEAPAAAPETSRAEPPVCLFTLSARNAAALRDLARRHLDHLSAAGPVSLESLCYTVNVGRRHFRHRAAVIAGSVADVRAALLALSSGEGGADDLLRGEAPRRDRPRLALVCHEEGNERAGMGWRLFQALPAFRETIERCGEVLRPHLATPLLEVLYGEGRGEERFRQVDEAHTALFAVQVALCEVWRSWGIVPGLVHGRGVGEYVAAWAAGILDLDAAILLVLDRAGALQAALGDAPDSAAFRRRLREVEFRPPRLEVVPSAAGASADDMARPAYWIDRTAPLASSPGPEPPEPPLPSGWLKLEIGPNAGPGDGAHALPRRALHARNGRRLGRSPPGPPPAATGVAHLPLSAPTLLDGRGRPDPGAAAHLSWACSFV